MTEDSDGLGRIYDELRSNSIRVQNEECDYCGWNRGSLIKDRRSGEVRCNTCYNDPRTYEMEPEEYQEVIEDGEGR